MSRYLPVLHYRLVNRTAVVILPNDGVAVACAVVSRRIGGITCNSSNGRCPAGERVRIFGSGRFGRICVRRYYAVLNHRLVNCTAVVILPNDGVAVACAVVSRRIGGITCNSSNGRCPAGERVRIFGSGRFGRICVRRYYAVLNHRLVNCTAVVILPNDGVAVACAVVSRRIGGITCNSSNGRCPAGERVRIFGSGRFGRICVRRYYAFIH